MGARGWKKGTVRTAEDHGRRDTGLFEDKEGQSRAGEDWELGERGGQHTMPRKGANLGASSDSIIIWAPDMVDMCVDFALRALQAGSREGGRIARVAVGCVADLKLGIAQDQARSVEAWLHCSILHKWTVFGCLPIT